MRCKNCRYYIPRYEVKKIVTKIKLPICFRFPKWIPIWNNEHFCGFFEEGKSDINPEDVIGKEE